MPRGDQSKPYALSKGSALAQLRIEAGYTQALAAEELGMRNPNSLSNIERGAVPTSKEKLAKMAKLYGVALARVERAYRAGRLAAVDQVRERGGR